MMLKEPVKKAEMVGGRGPVDRGTDPSPEPQDRRDATRKPEGVAEDLVAGPEVFYDTPCYYREYNWKTKKSKPLKLPPEPSYPFQPSVIERGIKVVPLADPCTDILEPTKDRGALHRCQGKHDVKTKTGKSGNAAGISGWSYKRSAMERYLGGEQKKEGDRSWDKVWLPTTDRLRRSKSTEGPGKSTGGVRQTVQRAAPRQQPQRKTPRRKRPRKPVKTPSGHYKDLKEEEFLMQANSKTIPVSTLVADYVSELGQMREEQDASQGTDHTLYTGRVRTADSNQCVFEVEREDVPKGPVDIAQLITSLDHLSDMLSRYPEEEEAEAPAPSPSTEEATASQPEGFNCLQFPWEKRLFKSPISGKILGYSKQESCSHTMRNAPRLTCVIFDVLVRYEAVKRKPAGGGGTSGRKRAKESRGKMPRGRPPRRRRELSPEAESMLKTVDALWSELVASARSRKSLTSSSWQGHRGQEGGTDTSNPTWSFYLMLAGTPDRLPQRIRRLYDRYGRKDDLSEAVLDRASRGEHRDVVGVPEKSFLTDKDEYTAARRDRSRSERGFPGNAGGKVISRLAGAGDIALRDGRVDPHWKLKNGEQDEGRGHSLVFEEDLPRILYGAGEGSEGMFEKKVPTSKSRSDLPRVRSHKGKAGRVPAGFPSKCPRHEDIPSTWDTYWKQEKFEERADLDEDAMVFQLIQDLSDMDWLEKALRTLRFRGDRE